MFGYDSRTTNIIFIVILVLFAISNSNFDLMSTVLTLPGLILALTLHEYAHAKTSDRLGDPTPESQGRLTLNPLAHMDPVGTVFLLFAGFGWGKPVEINQRYYRNPARDSMLVAAAGPISNFILALILFIILGIIGKFVPTTNAMVIVSTMIYLGAYINLSLGVFNLIPIPPLDGSKILKYFLKGKALEFLYTLETYSTLILLVLFITNIPSKIIGPVITWIGTGMLELVNLVIGLF